MNNDEVQGLSALDVLNVISCLLQVASFQQLMGQASSDDIYKELRQQDQRYLDQILRDQKEILKRLDRIESVFMPE